MEVLAALVVSTRELTAANLRLHLQDRAWREQIPEAFVRVERLPRNGMGKLMRNELARTIQVPPKPGT